MNLKCQTIPLKKNKNLSLFYKDTETELISSQRIKNQGSTFANLNISANQIKKKTNNYKSKTKSLIALWLQSSICPLAAITLHSVRATYTLFFLLFCSKRLLTAAHTASFSHSICPCHLHPQSYSFRLPPLSYFLPVSLLFSSVSALSLPSGNNLPIYSSSASHLCLQAASALVTIV